VRVFAGEVHLRSLLPNISEEPWTCTNSTQQQVFCFNHSHKRPLSLAQSSTSKPLKLSQRTKQRKMPEHNGIQIRLVSQYDAMFIREYHSPASDSNQSTTHSIDTYIPNYSSSHFWIRYACDEPRQEPEIRFFYFKLFIAGKFAVAWGCGAQDDWCGETFFVPSDSGSVATREKWGLFFPRDVEGDSEVPTFEIRVYRAKARRRPEREYVSAVVAKSGDGGVQ
jgi:hypothetical protein